MSYRQHTAAQIAKRNRQFAATMAAAEAHRATMTPEPATGAWQPTNEELAALMSPAEAEQFLAAQAKPVVFEKAPSTKTPAKNKAAQAEFTPTAAQTQAFQALFDYFNAQLFGGSLPQCLLNFSRKSKALGFFAPNRWGKHSDVKDGVIVEGAAVLHEISLNPDFIAISHLETCDTLVHEMCHLQRQITGKAPRGGYHDKAWGEMMLAVGLQPVGIPDPAKTTGQKVSDKPIPGGAFEVAFNAMPADLLLPFSHIAIAEKEKKQSTPSKVKFTCPQCEANVWGKPDSNVLCGDCEDERTGRPCKMLAEGEEPADDEIDQDDEDENDDEE